MTAHRSPSTKAPLNQRAGQLLVRLLTMALLALVAGVGATATTAQAVINETPRDCTSVPVDMMAACPKSTGTPAPSPQPNGSPPEADKKAGGAAKPGIQFGQDEDPSGWAGPIAKDLGQGVQGLASDLNERLKKGLSFDFEFSRAYLSLYSIMFGLGQVIAAAATMIAAVKLAERGVESRLLFRQAMIRLLTFAPVAGLAPLALAYASQLGQGLAEGFLTMAIDQFTAQLAWLVGALGVGTLAAVIVPGGGAVMVGLFLFLLASLAGVLLELVISHYLIFLLALFIPILYAASINPKWRSGVTKVTGGLLGAVLAPAALFLVWVVTFSAVPWGSGEGFLVRAGTIGVGLLLSLAAPLAIGMVLSYVVPAFSGGSYDGAAFGGLARQAGSKVLGGGRPQGPRSSRSKRASDASDSSGPNQAVEAPSKGGISGDAAATGGARNAGAGQAGITAGGPAAGGAGAGGAGAGGAGAGASGAGAGAAGAGAAAGPIGAAVGVWTGMVKKVRAGAEELRDRVAGRAEATSQADGGGAERRNESRTSNGAASDPKPAEDTNPSGQSKRSAGNVGDANDTATPGGDPESGDTAPPPRGREKESGDSAPPVSSEGPGDARTGGPDARTGDPATPSPAPSSTTSRRGSGTTPDTAKDASDSREGGGLGPSPAGPEFSQSGSEPGRGRSDDRGDV